MCGERAQVWQGRAGCPLEIQILGLSPLQNMTLERGRPEVDVRVLLWSFWGWGTRCTAGPVSKIREQSGAGPVSLCFEAWGPDVDPSWESGWRGGQGRAWGSSEQRGWGEEGTAREMEGWFVLGWGGGEQMPQPGRSGRSGEMQDSHGRTTGQSCGPWVGQRQTTARLHHLSRSLTAALSRTAQEEALCLSYRWRRGGSDGCRTCPVAGGGLPLATLGQGGSPWRAVTRQGVLL